MGPALVTGGDSDQTAPFITSQQCAEAAGMGAGASDNGKQMIAGGMGRYVFNVGACCLTAVGQLFESGTLVETGTSLYYRF